MPERAEHFLPSLTHYISLPSGQLLAVQQHTLLPSACTHPPVNLVGRWPTAKSSRRALIFLAVDRPSWLEVALRKS
jgi:hypothetical protein